MVSRFCGTTKGHNKINHAIHSMKREHAHINWNEAYPSMRGICDAVVCFYDAVIYGPRKTRVFLGAFWFKKDFLRKYTYVNVEEWRKDNCECIGCCICKIPEW